MTSVNTVAGAVALSVILLLPLCGAAAAWMLRGRRPGRSGSARRATATAAILVFSALAVLFIVAQPVTGLVRRKTEQIQIAQRGLLPNVLRIFRVVLTPVDAGEDTGSSRELTLAVDSSSFDRLAEGQSVMLRENRFGPLRFERLADVPVWNVLPWPEVQRFWPWDDLQDPPRAPTRTATADVLTVRTVREALLPSWTRPRETIVFPLPQAYDEVRLRLKIPGGFEAVAVDRVDVGSVPGLTVGRSLSVIVPDSRWREAHLAEGTRRYALRAWRGRIGQLIPQLIAGIAVALLLAWGLVTLIRRTARRGAAKRRGLVP